MPPDEPFVRHLPPAELAEQLRGPLQARYGACERSTGTAHSAEVWFELLVTAIQAEAHTLAEAIALAEFALAEAPSALTPEAAAALAGPATERVLRRFGDTVEAAALATPASANAWLSELRQHFRESEGLRGREVMLPLRAALTGTLVGPCLGNVTTLLGVTRCRQRVARTLDRILTGAPL
jgi:glutamyl/glutaminyl-tRNA synthetase